MNVACIATYVAFIALGAPVAGGTGLAMMALLAIKRSSNLPASIEKYLNPLFELLHIASLVNLPLSLFNLPLKIILTIELFSYINKLSPSAFLLLQNYKLDRWIPQGLKENLPGTWELAEGHEHAAVPTLDHLTINSTFIYAKEIGQILPEEQQDPRTSEELFTALEQRIEQEGIQISDNRREGLSKLKRGLLQGFYQDRIPSNLEGFTKVMRAFLVSLSQNRVDFGAQMQDFADIGNNCIDGWTRDINLLLRPETGNIRWSVHHQLSKDRSSLLESGLVKFCHTIARENADGATIIHLIGGGNNIHLHQMLARSLRHVMRPYQAEVEHTLHPPSLTNRLFVKYFLPSVKNFEESTPFAFDPDLDQQEKKRRLASLLSKAIYTVAHAGQEQQDILSVLPVAALDIEYNVVKEYLDRKSVV